MGQRAKGATDSSSTVHNQELDTTIELLPPYEPYHPHNYTSTTSTAPLLPPNPSPSTPSNTPPNNPPDASIAHDKARIDAAVAEASRLAATRVSRQLLVCGALLVSEAVAVGLVASAMGDWKRVKALPEEVRAPVTVVMILVIAEAMWIGLWLPIVLRCFLVWRHRILAVTVGILGVAAGGVSIYMLAVIGPYLGNGTCDTDKHPDACARGLAKGVAGGCVRVFVTAPLCIALAVIGFMAGRRHPPPRGPWTRFVYGIGALMRPVPS